MSDIVKEKEAIDLVNKHDKQYQEFKKTTYNFKSSTISGGYDLEQHKAKDHFYRRKFFDYNKTFAELCKNFLKCSKEDIDSTLLYWTGNRAEVAASILFDNSKTLRKRKKTLRKHQKKFVAIMFPSFSILGEYITNNIRQVVRGEYCPMYLHPVAEKWNKQRAL